MLTIRRIEGLGNSELEGLVAPLIEDSVADGFNMVRRLLHDFLSGENRFDRPGEALFVVLTDGAVIGIGGLNIDPFEGDGAIGRVRRMYVKTSHRRVGCGRILLNEIIRHATSSHFRELRLRTDSSAAAAFYESMGFERLPDSEHSTHRMKLSNVDNAGGVTDISLG